MKSDGHRAEFNLSYEKMESQRQLRGGVGSVAFSEAPDQKTQLKGCVDVTYYGAEPRSDRKVCVKQTTTKTDAFKMCGDQ